MLSLAPTRICYLHQPFFLFSLGFAASEFNTLIVSSFGRLVVPDKTKAFFVNKCGTMTEN